MIIGAHCSTDKNGLWGCLHSVRKNGGNALQIHLGLSYSTTTSTKQKIHLTPRERKEVKDYVKKEDIKLIIHASYTLNFCNPIGHGYFDWAIDNLVYDLNLGSSIGAKFCVIHLGSYKTKRIDLKRSEAIKNIIKAVSMAIDRSKGSVKVLLETPAESGHKIGTKFDEFATIFNKFPDEYKKKMGVCCDTQHLFTSGYHMNTVQGVVDYFDKFKKVIGMKYLRLLHINDSAVEFDSHRDKHESIGKGYIYDKKLGGNMEAFNEICKIAVKYKIPMILETPNSKLYKKEVGMLKKCTSLDKDKKKGGRLNGGARKKDHRKKIIEIFKKLEKIYQIEGNRPRTYAYMKIVRVLHNHDKPIYTIDDIKGLDGIGKKSLDKIDEIINTGKLDLLDRLSNKKKLDEHIELQDVLGIGPKIANKLIKKGIKSIDDLKKPSVKSKIELTKMQKLGLKFYRDLSYKIDRKEVRKFKNEYTKLLKKEFPTLKIHLAGSYHTGKSKMKDIDMIVTIDSIVKKTQGEREFKKIIEILKKNKLISGMLTFGKREAIIISKLERYNRHIDLRLVPKKYLPFYMLFFGSGVEFSKEIRLLAKKQGYKLTQWGLMDLKTHKYFDLKTERDIFKKLGIKYVKPSDRLKDYNL